VQYYSIFIVFSDVQHLPSVLGVVGKGSPSSSGKSVNSHCVVVSATDSHVVVLNDIDSLVSVATSNYYQCI